MYHPIYVLLTGMRLKINCEKMLILLTLSPKLDISKLLTRGFFCLALKLEKTRGVSSS